MKKKREAVGKYFAELLKTVGTAFVLTCGFGLALKRPEALNNLAVTVTFGVLGSIFQS